MITRCPPPGRRLALGLLAAGLLCACANDPSQLEIIDPDATDVVTAIDTVETSDAGFEDTESEDTATAPDTHTEDTATVEEDSEAPSDALPVVDPALVAVAVRTIAPAQVPAGQPFAIECHLDNADGDPVSPPEGARVVVTMAPSTAVTRDNGVWTALSTGTLRATCSVPDLLLIDEVGASVEVVPGPPAYVATWLDRDTVIAGEEGVSVACEVFDALGNPTQDAEVTVSVSPTAGEVVSEGQVAFTVAGEYAVSCDVDGAEGDPQPVFVTPNLPASFAMARSPSEPVVATGTIVVLNASVADRFGNPIGDAPLSFTSSPGAGDVLGLGRFLLDEDGTYTLTGRVTGPTDGGVTLSDTVTVVVNGEGPTIQCESGVMKNVSLSGSYTFTGSVSDPAGIERVRVNGQNATLNANGTFSRAISPRFGMNFVEVVAEDAHGAETSRLCTLLLADYWVGRTSYLDESVMIRLEQNAIDDGSRSGVDDSLADIVDTVIDSLAFENYIESLVKGAGTSGSMCLGVNAWGFCVGGTVSWNIKIDRLDIYGNNDVTLDLLSSNRIKVSATFRDVDVRLKITGTINTTVTAEVSSLTLSMTGKVALSGGKLNFNVTSGPSASASVYVNTSLPDWIDDIINSFARNRVEQEVEDAVEAAAAAAIGPLLDGVLGNLDVGALGGSFSVPRLAGGNATLTVALQQQSLSISSSRLLVGIGTRITSSQNVNSSPTLGVPLPSSSAFTYATGSSGEARAALYVGVINQALTTLWKAGFLDGNLDAVAGGALPSGGSVTLSSTLPPVAKLRSNGSVEIGLGGLRLRVELPGLFEGPDALVAEVGALARTTPSLHGGDELRFSDIVIEEFKFSTDVANLDPTTRETLEELFRELIEDIADTALNEALPAVPIPAFDIPSNSFGLSGTFLLYGPSLSSTSHHFLLSGTMRRQ